MAQVQPDGFFKGFKAKDAVPQPAVFRKEWRKGHIGTSPWASLRLVESPHRGEWRALATIDPTPVYRQAPDEDGFEWYYTLRVTETAGVPTTLTSFSIDGYDLSARIADWFGSANLAAKGALLVALRGKDLEVPADVVFAFGGVDQGGEHWSKKIGVPFLGPRTGAAMSLTSNPSTVVKIGKGDPNCSADHPYFQQLTLKELNGSEVKLTNFFAGGNDYSSNIAAWFGSQRLPALGTLRANLCWQLDSVPVTLSYEMDGVDSTGGKVQATLEVNFWSMDQKSGAGRGAVSVPVNAVEPALNNAVLPSNSQAGMTVSPQSARGRRTGVPVR